MEETINLVTWFHHSLLADLRVALRKPEGFSMTNGQNRDFIKKKNLKKSPKLAQTTVNSSQRLPQLGTGLSSVTDIFEDKMVCWRKGKVQF